MPVFKQPDPLHIISRIAASAPVLTDLQSVASSVSPHARGGQAHFLGCGVFDA